MSAVAQHVLAPGARTKAPRQKPQGFPVVGLLPLLRRDPLRFLVEVAREFGDVVELDLGLDRVLMLNHPNYIKHVSQDNYRNYHKSKFYGPLRPILGEGIFLAEGDVWVSQRRTAGRAFQGNELKKITEKMTAATSDLIERWQQYRKFGAPVDVSFEMARLTLDVVLRSLFNVDLDNRQQDIHWALTTLLRDAERRTWNLANLPTWFPTPRNLDCRHALSVLDDFVEEIIEERRLSSIKKPDLLQILIDEYADRPTSVVPRSLLRDQVLSMILAGHETSANALTWTWYLLSLHPEIGRQMRREVCSVIGDRAPRFEDLGNLKFTKMVFDEALRLYPPVWTISRTAVGDDTIGDIKVSKGTHVMLCAYAVHRCRRHWPNPEGFDPIRFDPDNSQQRAQYAYFPFGAGARSCLGARFGAMEALFILAMVSREFDLSLVPGQLITPEPMITLRPRGSVYMELNAP